MRFWQVHTLRSVGGHFMAAESGGIASKLGDFYEQQFAAEQLLRMLAGRLRRLRWEPASGEAGGADVELEDADGVVEDVQLKRQNRADAEWSIAALDREGVLTAAARLLSAHPASRFRFVSSDPVPHLKDICDQATRSSDSAARFVELRIKSNKDREAAFRELLRRWRLNAESADDIETAVARLRQMRFVVLDRGDEGREGLLLDAQQVLTGDPNKAIALLTMFLEQRLGQDILQQDVLEHLQSQGIWPRDLSRDPSLPSILSALREEFRAALRERLVAGTWIPRPQVGVTLEALVGPAPPRVLLVHGRPGAGKSAVLLGIYEGLIERGVPVLPLSLSARPPDEGSVYQYGESLGLHASPIAALRATAGTRRAVFLVDQLDALRLTTSGAAATWRTCNQMLHAAIADSDTVLIAACRTFDLENDPNIRRWKETIEQAHPDGVVTVHVADLAPTDVEPVLRSVQVEHSTLPSRLQRLLLHPGTLDVWHRLVTRDSSRRDFATHTQLLAQLIETLRLEALREHQTSEADLQMVLETARQHMETTGRLAVPIRLFDDRPVALRACCTVGLLVQGGAFVSFPHQSYFDHLVAKAALRTAGRSASDILAWIKRDQSLQRRDQLRQLLFVLQEEEPSLAADVTELLLNDSQARFHLKQLVFGVLREAEPVTTYHTEIIGRLARSETWAEHIARILWRSVTWFDALHSRGAWTTWLSNPRAEARLPWLSLVCSVMRFRPEAVDGLIAPTLAENGGAELLARVLPADPSEDSPSVAAVRDAQIRRGRWGLHDVMLDRVAQRDPERAVRLVESTIRGVLRRGLADAGSESRIEDLREQAFETEVARAVRAHASRSFRTFSCLLRACERLKRRWRRNAKEPENPDVGYFRAWSRFHGIVKILTKLVAESVTGLAECDPTGLQEVIEAAQVRRSQALSIAVALGLKQAPQSAADAALRWLCLEPGRLALRKLGGQDARSLAAQIIRRHAPHCSAEALRVVESALLTYFPQSEKESYRFWRDQYPKILARGHPLGQAQHLLLTAVPEVRRSDTVRQRLALWDAKFGGPPTERPDIQGGSVKSPIPAKALELLSDGQWLKIVSRRWTNRRRRQLGPDSIGEASPEHFAVDFGQSAKRSPSRFLRLALQFPSEAPPVYLARLWGALAEKSTDTPSCQPYELDALVDKTTHMKDREVIRAACHAIQVHPGAPWGDSIWRLLEIAAVHEEPQAEEYTVVVQEGGTSRPDLDSMSLNCVRGSAAHALGALAWNEAVRAKRVLPLARTLVADPHPAVRLAAADTALGIYTTDKDEGASLLLSVTAHADERVLAGGSVNRLVTYVRWSHPDRLHPLFERMARSSDPAASELGARWATAEFFQRGNACADLYRQCSSGSSAQRLGVAKTLAELVGDKNVEETVVEAELVRFFDDAESKVRAAAAGWFRPHGVLARPAGQRLASIFVTTAAFVDHCETLIRRLVNEAVDLTPYASIVFVAADRFANELAPQTRSIQNGLGLAGRELSALLLGLYDAAGKAGDIAIAESCLDRWDKLLAARVGDAEAHLESFVGS